MITVEISLFAHLRLSMGMSKIEVELPDETDVAGLLGHLESHFPKLAPHLSTCRVAIDVDYADPTTKLSSGDDVALIPPVQGG